MFATTKRARANVSHQPLPKSEIFPVDVEYRQQIFLIDSILRMQSAVCVFVDVKAVPLHAMEALGGRGGIAPTHSRPRH
jgi:hypothetical protein